MLLSSLVYFKISEYLGRKKSLIALTVPHLFSWIMVLSAQNKWWFYASRFLGGVGDCVLFCSVPTYIGEITTPTIRGYWGNFPVFILNLGMFSMTVVGTGMTALRDFYFTTYHSFPFRIFLKKKDSQRRRLRELIHNFPVNKFYVLRYLYKMLKLGGTDKRFIKIHFYFLTVFNN